MENPTRKQLVLASKLGLDVPEGITRVGLSKLLDGAIEANHRERRAQSNLPNDLVHRAGSAPIPNWRVEALEAFRQKGIRTGSIVRAHNRLSVVLGSHASDVLHFSTLTLWEHHFAPLEGRNMEHVYTPPTTHVHELCAYPYPKGAYANYKERLLAFRDFAASKLLPEQKFRNEYGEFWLRSAVEELLRQFDLQDEPASKEAPTSHDRYCVNCGAKRNARVFGNSGTCPGTCQRPLLKLRFCFKCGTKFNSYGAFGGAAKLCKDCRPKK